MEWNEIKWYVSELSSDLFFRRPILRSSRRFRFRQNFELNHSSVIRNIARGWRMIRKFYVKCYSHFDPDQSRRFSVRIGFGGRPKAKAIVCIPNKSKFFFFYSFFTLFFFFISFCKKNMKCHVHIASIIGKSGTSWMNFNKLEIYYSMNLINGVCSCVLCTLKMDIGLG